MQEKVKCPICGGLYRKITWKHLKMHGLTVPEFEELYPNFSRVSEALREEARRNQTGKKASPDTIAKMSESQTGRIHPDDVRLKMRLSKLGDKNPMYGMSGEKSPTWGRSHTPEEIQRQIENTPDMSGENNPMFDEHHTDESKQIMSENRIGKCVGPDNHNYPGSEKLVGSKNPNWRGGKSSERNLFMSAEVYHEWKTAVYQRDNYICQQCGATKCEVHAHHIYPFRDYSEPQFSLNTLNGITLCVKCHRETFGKEYDYLSTFLDATMGVNTQHEILISGTQTNEYR